MHPLPTSLLLLLLLSTSSFSSPSPPSPTSLTIYRKIPKRSSSESALREWAVREAGRVRGRYGTGGVGKREVEVEKRATGETSTSSAVDSTVTTPVGFVNLENYDSDLEYFAKVGMGSPPQYISVVLDTGSADLLLLSTTCNLTLCPTSNTTTKFNTSSSLSAISSTTPFAVKYGSGSAEGWMWKDYTGFAGYNVSNQSFAVVGSVSEGLLDEGLGGIMGLGWASLAASLTTPFWQNLYLASVLPFPGFAITLSRYINSTSAPLVTPGGSLTLGYLNESLYEGEVGWVNIPTGLESYWVVPLDSVAVGTWGGNMTVGVVNITGVEGGLVAIDTGTTLIGGPADVVESVYEQVEGSMAATGAYEGYYSFPCSTRVNISLGFGGKVYNITPDDFNLGPFGLNGNVSTCLGAFFDLSLSSSSKISWVIGAAFLKNVYTVYRASPPSVGFALLSSSNRTTYTSNSTSPDNTTRPIIPGGIFGPSGVSGGNSTTMGPAPITTAIQAGQTVSTVVNTGGGGRRTVRVGALVGLVGVGLAILR